MVITHSHCENIEPLLGHRKSLMAIIHSHWKDPRIIVRAHNTIVRAQKSLWVHTIIMKCGAVGSARKHVRLSGLRDPRHPSKDGRCLPAPTRIPGPEYGTTLPTKGHDNGIVAQNRVLHTNEVSKGPEGLANKLPFWDIPYCKRYIISGPPWGGGMHPFSTMNSLGHRLSLIKDHHRSME